MKAFLLALLIAGQTADIGITCAGIRSGRFAERNPLLPRSCAGIATTKALLTAADLALYPLLRKHHPRWAVALLVVPGINGLVAAGINIHIMKGTK